MILEFLGDVSLITRYSVISKITNNTPGKVYCKVFQCFTLRTFVEFKFKV